MNDGVACHAPFYYFSALMVSLSTHSVSQQEMDSSYSLRISSAKDIMLVTCINFDNRQWLIFLNYNIEYIIYDIMQFSERSCIEHSTWASSICPRGKIYITIRMQTNSINQHMCMIIQILIHTYILTTNKAARTVLIFTHLQEYDWVPYSLRHIDKLHECARPSDSLLHTIPEQEVNIRKEVCFLYFLLLRFSIINTQS